MTMAVSTYRQQAEARADELREISGWYPAPAFPSGEAADACHAVVSDLNKTWRTDRWRVELRIHGDEFAYVFQDVLRDAIEPWVPAIGRAMFEVREVDQRYPYMDVPERLFNKRHRPNKCLQTYTNFWQVCFFQGHDWGNAHVELWMMVPMARYSGIARAVYPFNPYRVCKDIWDAYAGILEGNEGIRAERYQQGYSEKWWRNRDFRADIGELRELYIDVATYSEGYYLRVEHENQIIAPEPQYR